MFETEGWTRDMSFKIKTEKEKINVVNIFDQFLLQICFYGFYF